MFSPLEPEPSENAMMALPDWENAHCPKLYNRNNKSNMLSWSYRQHTAGEWEAFAL